MARAARLWAVAAALLGAVLPALGQSSWPAQVVDTAPSGTCSATTYKGTVVVRNTADLWRCLDLDGNGTANWTPSRAVRYHDLDTDGNGVPDYRIVGDYDGDGTLEFSDIDSGIDTFCDSNSDGTQNSKLADLDGDGSVDDLYCGTVVLLPGRFVSGSTWNQIKNNWSGLTIRGSGSSNTVIASTYTRNTLCTTAPNSPFDSIMFLGPGSDHVTVEGITFEGVGARSSAIADCDGDGTSGDLQAQSAVEIVGRGPNDYGAPYDVSHNIRIRDVRTFRADRMGLHLRYIKGLWINDVETAGGGEHGFAIGFSSHVFIDNAYSHDNLNVAASRGIEIFSGGTDGWDNNGDGTVDDYVTGDYHITNSSFDHNYQGAGVFTGTTNHIIDGVYFDNVSFTNSYDPTAGTGNTGIGLRIDGTSAGKVKNIRVSNCTFEGNTAQGVNMAIQNGADDVIISSSMFRGNNQSLDSAGYYSFLLPVGSNILVTGNQFRIGDEDSDGTYDASYAIYDGSCTGCVYEDNVFSGSLRNTYSVYWIRSTQAGTIISGNKFFISGAWAQTAVFVEGNNTKIIGNSLIRSAFEAESGFLLNTGATGALIQDNYITGPQYAVAGWGNNTKTRVIRNTIVFQASASGGAAILIADGSTGSQVDSNSIDTSEFAGDGVSVGSSSGATGVSVTNNYCNGNASGYCFRNVAGSTGMVIRNNIISSGNPYSVTAATIAAYVANGAEANGAPVLSPSTTFPTSQCATWDASGQLIGSGSACGGGGGTTRRTIGITVDGGASSPATGIKGSTRMAVAGTIKKWTILADVVGSIQFGVWKDTLANYPPTVADSICASACPALSSDDAGEDSTLTGWTTSVSAGDVIRFNLDSVTTIKQATLIIEIE